MPDPPMPPEVTLGPGEALLGAWDIRIELHDSVVSNVLHRFILTNARLVVLELPTAIPVARLASRLSFGARRGGFMAEMGRWHVLLSAKLVGMPEPRLERVVLTTKTALPSTRALTVGDKRLWVGEDPVADEMYHLVRLQWGQMQPIPGGREHVAP